MARYEAIQKTIKPKDGAVEISAAGIPPELTKSMEYGNRVAVIPDGEHAEPDEQMRMLGLPVTEDQEAYLNGCEVVTDKEDRLPRFKRLEKYGKVIQVVGCHPTAKDFIRPKGVDEVWAINPRAWWPQDNPPDLIITRDIYYLEGPSEIEPTAVTFGVENLRRFPDVPILTSADLTHWVMRRVKGEVPMPEHLKNRMMLELPMQNFWDGEFCNLAGYTIGLAMAAARFVGAKIVLTGVVCERTKQEEEEITARRKKLFSSVVQEDRHIAAEMLAWMNPRGGKLIWTHGPTMKGSVVPAWAC